MKIVIVGGVAGGASVAARARRLDETAEIIVFERGGYVSFANCGLPYHIGGVISDRSRLLLQTPESLRESLNIDVRIGSDVVALDATARTSRCASSSTGREYTETYDALALCQGADPLQLPLPGADLPGIHVLRNIHDMDEIKASLEAALDAADSLGRPTRAVVIGAGYIGVEMAENLRHRGAKWPSDRGARRPDPAAARQGRLTAGRAAHPRARGRSSSGHGSGRVHERRPAAAAGRAEQRHDPGCRPRRAARRVSAPTSHSRATPDSRSALAGGSSSTRTCARRMPRSGQPAMPSRRRTRCCPAAGSPRWQDPPTERHGSPPRTSAAATPSTSPPRARRS